MIGTTISHYRITEKLGEGGMGVVYKAEDTALDRPVALKFLAAHLVSDEDIRKRFEREAKAAAALNHPNICIVHEIDEFEGKTFIAMAFLEGEGLDKKIEAGPLKLKDALDVAIQTAKGLQAAHGKGIVHRDIKPANLMVGPEGHVTIMDFGLAQLADRSKLTRLDETMGTVTYMSPEQTYGADIDHRSDIWSLGVVIYEMVTGQQPFKGHYDKAVMYSITSEEPEPMTALRTGVPMELELLVNKCLAKDAGKRYQSTADMVVDLESLSDKLKSGKSISLPAQAGSQTIVKERAALVDELVPKRTLRMFQALLAIVAIVAIVAVVLGTLATRDTVQERRLRKFSFTPGALDSSVPFGRAEVSPNGRHIAYVAGGEQTKLWVRDLSGEESRPLEGTEGATAPFWSPDSRLIGFGTARYGQSGGVLKKIPLQGGPSTTVCRLKGHFFGGSWSPDGELIVYAASFELFQVPSRGGDPRLVIAPEESSGPDYLYTPHFLPLEAGKRILLFSTVFDSQIMLRDLETGMQKFLATGSNPVYSPSGHVVYEAGHRAGALWALPFSIETLETAGEAFPFGIDGQSSEPSVAADGTLVYVGGRPQQQLAWRDSLGEMVEKIGQPQQELQYPSLSPDGRHVTVKGFEKGIPESDIWILDLAGSIRTRLTYDPRQDSRPIWSSTGQQVTFVSQRSGGYDIFVRAVDGSGTAEALTANPFKEGPGDWSTDGRFLVFDRVHPEDGDDIWYLKRKDDGQGFEEIPFLQTPFAELNPKLSPDGRFIAYQSDESGRFEIYVKPFPEGDDKWPVSRNGGDDPRWSQDGKELFYVEGATLVSVAVVTDPAFSAGEATSLFSAPSLQNGGYPNYDVSSDGRRFLLVENVEVEPLRIHVVQDWYEEFRDHEQD